ncbi:unnamed protein product [Haemonchus placei]|uniref:WH2 domain-containing protein n=1 Tax=Haemonchus placei TaxID=6290 RepID=A0A0N4WNX9_HAEPC|nr:unnamed protein product [Haemonchus placei]
MRPSVAVLEVNFVLLWTCCFEIRLQIPQLLNVDVCGHCTCFVWQLPVFDTPKLDVVRKTTLRALSVDIGDKSEEENKNRTTAMQAKRRAAEVKSIDDLLNRNVDQANPGDSASLLAHLIRQDDGKLPNMPNGYP